MFLLLKNLRKVYKAFYWNELAWFYSLYKDKNIKSILHKHNHEVLEIGATETSQLSLLLRQGTYKKLLISLYESKSLNMLNKSVRQNFKNHKTITTGTMDIKDVKGYYDLIIIKSVLGGLYKNQTLEDPEEIILKIVRNNLKPQGNLITIDNGKSLIGEKLFKDNGQRKKGWKYFTPNDFPNAAIISSFGFFSCISIGSRIGLLGHIIDVVNFFMDLVINNFIEEKHKAIHCILYKKSFYKSNI